MNIPLEPPRLPPHSPSVSDVDRRNIAQDKGKIWAGDVTAENAWQKLVLTLDGGGIRGYSELLILQELMVRVAAWEHTLHGKEVNPDDLLPCHYFDYMWGTSTGGLICLMLGRLRMSVPQALAAYRNLGFKIFGKRRWTNMRGVNPFGDKFEHKKLAAAVQEITRTYCKLHRDCTAEDKLLWPNQSNIGADNENSICQAVLVTTRTDNAQGNDQMMPLRTYRYIYYDDPALGPDPFGGKQDLDLNIWEAARATSAAMNYFKMFQKRDSNGRLRRYKDGATTLNNPAAEACNEVQNRDGHNATYPALLLSIGTGLKRGAQFAHMEEDDDSFESRRRDVPFHRAVGNRFKTTLINPLREKTAMLKTIKGRMTDAQGVHTKEMRARVRQEYLWYRRLNVDVGLAAIDLGEWEPGSWRNPETGEMEQHTGGATLTKMERVTHDYLERTELHTEDGVEVALLPSEHLDHIAERLVRHRAKRRELVKTDDDRIRWHTHQGRFVTGVRMEPWTDESSDPPIDVSLSSTTTSLTKDTPDLKQ